MENVFETGPKPVFQHGASNLGAVESFMDTVYNPHAGPEWGVWCRLGEQGWIVDPDTGIPTTFTNLGVAAAFCIHWIEKEKEDPDRAREIQALADKGEVTLLRSRFCDDGTPHVPRGALYVWEDGVGLVKKPQEAPE